ncbi:MAG: sulfur carrier protein ThiS [Deltaproteobacteria bacterium]|nr:sulfur carrier protein ThiS [Deltaproteobacteria bacterium]
MKISVNGRTAEIAEGTTVEGLLKTLGIPLQGIAVELNGEIVPSGEHPRAALKEADSIEIVRMVGGG